MTRPGDLMTPPQNVLTKQCPPQERPTKHDKQPRFVILRSLGIWVLASQCSSSQNEYEYEYLGIGIRFRHLWRFGGSGCESLGGLRNRSMLHAPRVPMSGLSTEPANEIWTEFCTGATIPDSYEGIIDIHSTRIRPRGSVYPAPGGFLQGPFEPRRH